jgi:predicted nucleotidyltransferase
MVSEIIPTSPCLAKRIYGSPLDMNHRDYFDSLVSFNQAIFMDAQKVIEEVAKGHSNIAVCTTGSDSRLEKGPKSDIELIVLAQTQKKGQNFIKSDLSALIENCKELTFDPDIELQALNQGYLSYTDFGYKGNIPVASPDRMFDCCFFSGDISTYFAARELFIDELLNQDIGRSVLKKVTDRLRMHKKHSIEGTQKYKENLVTHYNPDSGIAYYDPINNASGFKQLQLRVVQTALVRDIIRGIRAETIDPSYSFTCHGSEKLSVPKKIGYFGTRDLLAITSEQARDLIDNYRFFLWGYHCSETNYTQNKQIKTQFDPKEVKDRTNQLLDYCTGPHVKLLKY